MLTITVQVDRPPGQAIGARIDAECVRWMRLPPVGCDYGDRQGGTAEC